MTCWIGVASRDHVKAAIKGGFAQAGHGKMAPVKRMKRGDHILYYSPRERLDAGEQVQAFTAIGRVEDDEPHQAIQSECFEPFRRKVLYFQARDAAIRPLLEDLDLTRGRAAWGIAFRRSLFKIDDRDFRIIARVMDAALPSDFWRCSH